MRTRSFSKRGITVIPDVLCNAGGVTVSYFEWVQDLQFMFWKEAEVKKRLDQTITDAFSKVYATASSKNLDMRTAAYLFAIQEVVKAIGLRGTYP